MKIAPKFFEQNENKTNLFNFVFLILDGRNSRGTELAHGFRMLSDKDFRRLLLRSLQL